MNCYLFIIFILFLFALSCFIQRCQKNREDFINSEKEDNIPISIPTFATYEPQNSGRHLNFFSHAPKETPYYPEKIWTSMMKDPYFQPFYNHYFYQDGYYYPLF